MFYIQCPAKKFRCLKPLIHQLYMLRFTNLSCCSLEFYPETNGGTSSFCESVYRKCCNGPTAVSFHFIIQVVGRATHSLGRSSNNHLFIKRLSSFARCVFIVCARSSLVFYLLSKWLWLKWYFLSSTKGRRCTGRSSWLVKSSSPEWSLVEAATSCSLYPRVNLPCTTRLKPNVT